MEWCVRSWDEIRMVHRSMKNGSRVADELYIKRVLVVLEGFLFFSLYSFSCIASNSPTLKHILIFVPRYALRVQSCNIHITCVRPRPLQRGPSLQHISFEIFSVYASNAMDKMLFCCIAVLQDISIICQCGASANTFAARRVA